MQYGISSMYISNSFSLIGECSDIQILSRNTVLGLGFLLGSLFTVNLHLSNILLLSVICLIVIFILRSPFILIYLKCWFYLNYIFKNNSLFSYIFPITLHLDILKLPICSLHILLLYLTLSTSLTIKAPLSYSILIHQWS